MHRIIEKVIDINGGQVISVCESPHQDALFGIKFKNYLYATDEIINGNNMVELRTGEQVSDEVHQEIIDLVEGYDE